MTSISIKINDSWNGNITIETEGDSIVFEQYKRSEEYNDWMTHKVVIKSENLDKLIKYLQIIKEDL
jgi:hypothetical protein